MPASKRNSKRPQPRRTTRKTARSKPSKNDTITIGGKTYLTDDLPNGTQSLILALANQEKEWKEQCQASALWNAMQHTQRALLESVADLEVVEQEEVKEPALQDAQNETGAE